jgi:hypothetical protein
MGSWWLLGPWASVQKWRAAEDGTALLPERGDSFGEIAAVELADLEFDRGARFSN